MAKIPDSITSQPLETFIAGQTVYWWNGEHWTERRFVAAYPAMKAMKAVKLRFKLREQIVSAGEIISRERYLKYKASQARR